MAEIIRTNGEREPVEPKNGNDFNLQEITDIVNGYIEIAETTDGRLMVLNEEGKLLGLPFNPVATELYKYNTNDFIVGDVLVCDRNQIK